MAVLIRMLQIMKLNYLNVIFVQPGMCGQQRVTNGLSHQKLFSIFFERKRAEIRNRFQRYLANYPYAGVLVALVVEISGLFRRSNGIPLPARVPAISWQFPVRMSH